MGLALARASFPAHLIRLRVRLRVRLRLRVGPRFVPCAPVIQPSQRSTAAAHASEAVAAAASVSGSLRPVHTSEG